MNEQTTEQFRQQLVALRLDLQAQEETFKETSQPVELDQARVGRLSRMDAMQSQQMALESSRRRQQQLVKIEGAMQRIDAGEYGRCFVCDEEIDVRRLAVDPTSTRCVACVER